MSYTITIVIIIILIIIILIIIISSSIMIMIMIMIEARGSAPTATIQAKRLEIRSWSETVSWFSVEGGFPYCTVYFLRVVFS